MPGGAAGPAGNERPASTTTPGVANFAAGVSREEHLKRLSTPPGLQRAASAGGGDKLRRSLDRDNHRCRLSPRMRAAASSPGCSAAEPGGTGPATVAALEEGDGARQARR